MADDIQMGPNVPINNIVIPGEGPRAVAVTLNFTNTPTINIQGLLAVTTGKISFIQGAYIDNGSNTAALNLTVLTTGQRVTIPAGGQGYYPILTAQTPNIIASTTQAAVEVGIIFYNVPLQAQQWNVNDTGGGGGALTDAELRASPLEAPIGGAWTNRSIANLSGASENLMVANANRRHLIIQNIAANSMGVNLGGGVATIGTAGTITLTAGSSIELFNYPPTGAITIIGTLNDDVTAFEG
jgi:hypothetical protein